MYLRLYETRHHAWLAEPITEKEVKDILADTDDSDSYVLKTSSRIQWPAQNFLTVENMDLPGDLLPWEINEVSILQNLDGLIIQFD